MRWTISKDCRPKWRIAWIVRAKLSSCTLLPIVRKKWSAECGSDLVADLLEVHAQTCERNAKMTLAQKTEPFRKRAPRLVSKEPELSEMAGTK